MKGGDNMNMNLKYVGDRVYLVFDEFDVDVTHWDLELLELTKDLIKENEQYQHTLFNLKSGFAKKKKKMYQKLKIP